MKVSIGNDHAGTKHKFKIVEYLEKKKTLKLRTTEQT